MPPINKNTNSKASTSNQDYYPRSCFTPGICRTSLAFWDDVPSRAARWLQSAFEARFQPGRLGLRSKTIRDEFSKKVTNDIANVVPPQGMVDKRVNKSAFAFLPRKELWNG
ncbi:hypothetical protein Tco_0812858 [Tanacetum coccineum]